VHQLVIKEGSVLLMHGVTMKFNSKDLWDVNVHFALKGCRMGCDPGFCEHGFEPSGSIKA